MIALALLLAAADPSAAPASASCQAAVEKDPEGWLAADRTAQLEGDRSARLCRGLAYAALERWEPAAAAFEAAARMAARDSDPHASTLWLQAGNAALALGDAGRARTDINSALAAPELVGQMRGEAMLDLARADVQAGDPAAARAALDEALTLVPADPMAWLLSATLARRQGETPRARTDIAEAVNRAPDDPAVAYEAGNVAREAGVPEAARVAWTRAAAIDPGGAAGQAAKQALATLGDAPPAAAAAIPPR